MFIILYHKLLLKRIKPIQVEILIAVGARYLIAVGARYLIWFFIFGTSLEYWLVASFVGLF